MPSVIQLVSRPGRERAINAHYKAELGKDFLIWTRAVIAARIRAVNAGEVEALLHLRGQLETIEDWNRALPEMAEGHGSVLIADHEATLTQVELISLRREVLFIEKHHDDFSSIEGMDVAQMLLGGAGRKGIGVVAPAEPQSEIYLLCVRHTRLDLWTLFCNFRAEPSKHTWAGLQIQTVPWLGDRTVRALIEQTSGYSTSDEFPSALVLRRALLPATLPPTTSATGPCLVRPLPPRKR